MTDDEPRSRRATAASRRTIVRTAGRLAYATPVVAVTYQLGLLTDQARAADGISGGADSTSTPTPPPGGRKRPPPAPGRGDEPSGGGTRPPVADTNDSDDALEVSLVRVLPNTGDGGSRRPNEADGCR